MIGTWIQVEQTPYQIVGIAQQGFSGAQPGVLTDVWLPNMMFDRGSLQAPQWNWLARLVETRLFEVQPVSLSSLSLPLLCLLLVAVVATWAPLRRAIRVDPVNALRTE